ncbi:hypothetical protein FQN60_004514, partial [Etheostoma spectabile]
CFLHPCLGCVFNTIQTQAAFTRSAAKLLRHRLQGVGPLTLPTTPLIGQQGVAAARHPITGLRVETGPPSLPSAGRTVATRRIYSPTVPSIGNEVILTKSGRYQPVFRVSRETDKGGANRTANR